MKAPASLPIFGDAYLADTQHLTLEEHGAYFKLLLCAWRTSACELPADDKRIATMLGISAAKWGKLKPAVIAFWTRTETGWQQKRLTKERAFVEEKRAKNISAINTRWQAKPLENKQQGNTDVYTDVIPLSPTHLLTEEETIADAMDGKPSPAELQPVDLKAVLFSTGVAYLTKNGSTERNARSMLGKWRQQYGDGAVVDAMHLAQSEACSNPIPMITKILERKNGHAGQSLGGTRPIEYRRDPAWEGLKRLQAEFDDGWGGEETIKSH